MGATGLYEDLTDAEKAEVLASIIARWDANEGKPYKGQLIDWDAYGGDGEEPPANIGCMCAQAQVLHLLGGWSPSRLNGTEQEVADRETAKLLGISIAHAILLRNVNDNAEGAPSIVLTSPEKVLGDQAHIVLAFWRHLDRMTAKDWHAAGAAAWDAAIAAAGAAARNAARNAAIAAARNAAIAAGGAAAIAAGGAAARDAASYACAEIQGARLMRERGQPFFFLQMFGFADPEAVLAADAKAAEETAA